MTRLSLILATLCLLSACTKTEDVSLGSNAAASADNNTTAPDRDAAVDEAAAHDAGEHEDENESESESEEHEENEPWENVPEP